MAGLVKTSEKAWWVYIIQCRDTTFYTGITTDVENRVRTHQAGRGARYTRGRGPMILWYVAGPFNRSEALREELRIKQLSHHEKESMGGV